ncbi:AraC family transcriptional regulator [Amycolatopsis sp. NPDC051106]|uniref:AraC family transcriptional regulator n=1 Tax=unclassified Amycolatopsis TaxID=2618356 RepID=UPI0034481223
MDLISEVIRAVRVGSANARLIRQTDRRGVRFPAFAGSGFHIVLRGTCWLITEDAEPVALRAGDIVLTSTGVEHGLHTSPGALENLPAVTMGPFPPADGPAEFEFLCGAYRLERGRVPQYLRALPDPLAVSPDYDRDPEMHTLVDLLAADVSERRLGGGATLPALLDLILVKVLRQWHDQHDAYGWPQTDDPAVAAALRRIHENPERPWTLAGLGAAVGLSRSVFTRRFTAVVGRPPMSYLTSWRLDRGAGLLRETDASLATIARRVGYSSEFAFSGAFRREYGMSPGRFRRPPETSRASVSGRPDDAPGSTSDSAGPGLRRPANIS